MTLTIHFTPTEEARLDAVARQEGIDPAALAKKLVIDRLAPVASSAEEDPTLTLFAQWDREDAQMTPEEVQAAQEEFEDFKRSINAERVRAGSRIIYP